MAEEDLYSDLVKSGTQEEIHNLTAELEDLKLKLSTSQREIHELKYQLHLILEEKKVLENNVSVIYNTAVREVDRKDKELERLNRLIISLRKKT